MEKKLQEMMGKVNQALTQFEDQTGDITALKTAMVEMQKTLASLPTSKALTVSSDHLGFVDEDDAKSFVAFAKAAYQGKAAEDQEIQTDADGGYLVPEEFRPTLIRLVESFGAIRRSATVLPMSKSEMVFPKLTSSVTVYWPDEAATISKTKAQFGELRLIAKKMAALVPITSELIEDSTLPVANLLATLFAEAIAQEEDRVCLTGDAGGSDPFDGVLNDTGVAQMVMATGDTDFTDLDADYLADMIASMTSAQLRGAKFYMHRTIFNIVRKLKDTTGDYIYQKPAGTQPGTLWGVPYELSDVMPAITDTAVSTPFIALGNPRHIYIGDRRQMSFQQSQHFAFDTDRVFLRVTQRVAMAVGIPAAWTVLVTAAT